MAKSRSRYVCNACGAESPQWFGKCPGCGTWGSLVEEAIPASSAAPSSSKTSANLSRPASRSRKRRAADPAGPLAAVPLEAISDRRQPRFPSGYGELDRVLGGGLVPGSLVLLGGDPGIGKSTLLLQVAHYLARDRRVLYACAEESGQQVKLRAQRLGAIAGTVPKRGASSQNSSSNNSKNSDSQKSSSNNSETQNSASQTSEPQNSASRDSVSPNAAPRNSQSPTSAELPEPGDRAASPAENRGGAETSDPTASAAGGLYVLPETDLEQILAELEALRPAVAVIDSIQALYFAALGSAPGSVSQVRECTSALMRVAKRDDITLLIVGHVTKEGAIAGPKVLEHLVDTVLYFEGDRFASFRLLRSVKNRFGATQELGVFEMADRGLREVVNPSALFLGDRDERVPGTATIVACEGTRPLVVELQALTSPTSYSSPRRVTTGIGFNRLLQILAVLEKRVGVPLSRLDAYVSTSGGLTVEEPAADLGVAVALVASFRDRAVNPLSVAIGEVGLGGQVRPVSQMELRLKEAKKLGFRRAIVPKGQGLDIPGLEVIPVSRVVDAIATALQGSTAADAAG